MGMASVKGNMAPQLFDIKTREEQKQSKTRNLLKHQIF